jgi:hypothetical protein
MAAVTLPALDQLIHQRNLRVIATPAAAAYLNVLMSTLRTQLQQKAHFQLTDWLNHHRFAFRLRDRDMVEPAITIIESWPAPQIVSWIIDRFVFVIIQESQYGASIDGGETEARVLTPWDIAEVISGDYAWDQIFNLNFWNEKLPVNVMVRGHPFTHHMTMDLAMGILLFSQTAGDVQFGMMMYGAPLEYFMPGTFTKYDRSENNMIGFEYSLGLTESDRYYFVGTDFLQGFKTGAEWAGLDHYDYWVDLRDVDNNQLTF